MPPEPHRPRHAENRQRHRLSARRAPEKRQRRLGVPHGRHPGLAAHQPQQQAHGLRHPHLGAARRPAMDRGGDPPPLPAAFLAWHLRRQAARDARNDLRQTWRRDNPRAAQKGCSTVARGSRPSLLQRMGAYRNEAACAQSAALDAAQYANPAWNSNDWWHGFRPWLRPSPARRAHATVAAAVIPAVGASTRCREAWSATILARRATPVRRAA